MNLEVTWEPMADPLVDALPEATRQSMDSIHRQLFSEPTKAIGKLRVMVQTHPDILCLKNWLIAALTASGAKADRAEGTALAEQLFRDRPDYLFARLGLADVYMAEGKFQEAAALLFGPDKIITLLCPGRKVFHISEIRHWAHSCCRAYIGLGNLSAAQNYRDLLAEVEPDAPAFRHLDRLLNPDANRLSQMVSRLLQSIRRPPPQK